MMEIYSLDKINVPFLSMDVLVISGFLGAGKTTFIRQLTQSLPGNYCILENEFGESEVDRTILESEGLKVFELSSGCICCSNKGNFETSVMTIANTLSPRTLIIETSGVSLLSSVINSLRKIEYDRIKILDPIVIVDAINYHECNLIKNNTFLDQIKNAKNIVLSKINNASTDEISRIKTNLSSITPLASIYTDSEFNSPIWLKNNMILSSDVPDVSVYDYNDSKWDTATFIPPGNTSINKIVCFLQMIVNGLFGYIPRTKGFIKIGSDTIKIDTVGKIYSIEMVNVVTDMKIVIIGQDIKFNDIFNFLNERIE